MNPAPTSTTAAEDHATSVWLRGLLWRAAAAGSAAVTTAAVSATASPGAAVLLRCAASALACWSVLWVLTWRTRRRALGAAAWRAGDVEGSTSATMFGTLRTTVAVTYDSGTTIAYRLDDLTTVRAATAICDAPQVWVASSPKGTVIATPGLGHVAGARPHHLPR